MSSVGVKPASAMRAKMPSHDETSVHIRRWESLTGQLILRLRDGLVGCSLRGIRAADERLDPRSTRAQRQANGRAELDSVAVRDLDGVGEAGPRN